MWPLSLTLQRLKNENGSNFESVDLKKKRNATTQMTITEKLSCGAVSYVVKGGYNS